MTEEEFRIQTFNAEKEHRERIFNAEQAFREKSIEIELKKIRQTTLTIIIPLAIAAFAYSSSVLMEYMRSKDRQWSITDKFETTMIDLLVEHESKPCELKEAVNVIYEADTDWPWLNRLRKFVDKECETKTQNESQQNTVD